MRRYVLVVVIWALASAGFAVMPDGPMWREVLSAMLFGLSGLLLGMAPLILCEDWD